MTIQIEVKESEIHSGYEAFIPAELNWTYYFVSPSAFGGTQNEAIKNLLYCLEEIGFSGDAEYVETKELSFGKKDTASSRDVAEELAQNVFRESVTSHYDPNITYEISFYPKGNGVGDFYTCTCPHFYNRLRGTGKLCKHLQEHKVKSNPTTWGGGVQKSREV